MARAKRVWTRKSTEKFIAEKFTDRIAWIAARTLLVRLSEDPSFFKLDLESRLAVERFLSRNPAPVVKRQLVDAEPSPGFLEQPPSSSGGAGSE